MADRYLSEIFSLTQRNNALFDAPEQPSDKIAVKILLQKSVSLVLKDLNKRLTTDNMKASRDDNNKNAIIVRGIPPYNGYGPQDILKVVENVDRGARII